MAAAVVETHEGLSDTAALALAAWIRLRSPQGSDLFFLPSSGFWNNAREYSP